MNINAPSLGQPRKDPLEDAVVRRETVVRKGDHESPGAVKHFGQGGRVFQIKWVISQDALQQMIGRLLLHQKSSAEDGL
jgi:hypothetical protein